MRRSIRLNLYLFRYEPWGSEKNVSDTAKIGGRRGVIWQTFSWIWRKNFLKVFSIYGAVKVLAEHGFGLPGVPPHPPT